MLSTVKGRIVTIDNEYDKSLIFHILSLLVHPRIHRRKRKSYTTNRIDKHHKGGTDVT